MTTTLKSIATAGLILVLIAVQAPGANAQASIDAQISALLAQIAALQGNSTASASMTFTRDLTIGSTGADVTALQNWLISKGHVISAGATGYFGAKTAAALAAYQAAHGISPASGYFGPITRSRINQPVLVPTPEPAPVEDGEDEDQSEDEQADRDNAEDEIDDIRDDLSDARDEVEEADDDGDEIGDAEDLLDEAEDLIEDAEEALDDEDYDDVSDLVSEAEDLIEEALDEIGSDNNDDDEADSSNIDSSTSRNEAGNVGTFSFEFNLKAVGGDLEFDESDIDYEVIGPSNNSVNINLVRISGDADEDNGTFTIEEGDDASFSFDVTVTVDTNAENGSYRVNLDNILGSGVDETTSSLLLTNA